MSRIQVIKGGENTPARVIMNGREIKQYKVRINRKAINAVRKKYKDFRTYMEGVRKLSQNNKPAPDVHEELWGMQKTGQLYNWERMYNPRFPAARAKHLVGKDLDEFLEIAEKGEPEEWYILMMWLAEWGTDPEAAFDAMLKRKYADEVFDIVEVEENKYVWSGKRHRGYVRNR